MKHWLCPRCQLTVDAIALEVTHRCPQASNRWIWFRIKGTELTTQGEVK